MHTGIETKGRRPLPQSALSIPKTTGTMLRQFRQPHSHFGTINFSSSLGGCAKIDVSCFAALSQASEPSFCRLYVSECSNLHVFSTIFSRRDSLLFHLHIYIFNVRTAEADGKASHSGVKEHHAEHESDFLSYTHSINPRRVYRICRDSTGAHTTH
jgi:hypothetical protein